MLAYKIHLIRTGSTSDGMWRRYVGQRNLPLSDKGGDAIRALREEFRYPDVDMVFTSPLSRCLQTAGILYPDAYMEELSGLTDLCLGGFEGKTVEELRGNEDFERWMENSLLNPPPGGEKAEAFTGRILGSLGDIFSRMMEGRMRSVAAVTHAGVIMTLLTTVGQPRLPLHEWKINNGCGYTLLMTPQLWMRDRSCEVFCHQPQPVLKDDGRDELEFYE